MSFSQAMVSANYRSVRKPESRPFSEVDRRKLVRQEEDAERSNKQLGRMIPKVEMVLDRILVSREKNHYSDGIKRAFEVGLR